MALVFEGPFSLNPSQTMDSSSTQAPQCIPIGFQVGTNLYYVTEATTGSVAGGQDTHNIWIQKSTDGGHTWTKVQDNASFGTFGQGVALSGTKIYIFGQNSNAINTNLWVFRFDTATDSMVDAGTDFGFTVGTPHTAATFNDGKILLCSFVNSIGDIAAMLYNPVSNTIGAPVQIGLVASGINLINEWLVHDPTTDLMIVGLTGGPLTSFGAPTSAYHGVVTRVIDETVTAQAAVLAALMPTNIGGLLFPDFQTTPVIVGSKIFYGFRNYASGGFPPNNMSVVNATIGLSMTWSANEDLSASQLLWVFANSEAFGWGLAADNAGTVYAFYTINTNFNDNSTSQTSIWYQQRLGTNSWGTPQNVWTGPLPSSGSMMYPVKLTNGIGIWEAYFNPVLYVDAGNPNNLYNSLTVLFFAPPSSSGAPCSGNTAQPTTDVQFELKRVYATMTPHKRIPIRGS